LPAEALHFAHPESVADHLPKSRVAAEIDRLKGEVEVPYCSSRYAITPIANRLYCQSN
jgi:uncharacterized Zn-finger protein